MLRPGIALHLLALTSFAQPPANFLQRAFGASTIDGQPLLSPAAPGISFQVASREPRAAAGRLTFDGIPIELELRYERRSGIDLYRIRHAPSSELRAEQIRLAWTFPASFNESMTFDAGALQGQPLFLPNGKIPDNQFTNWGSLFYDRAANLAVGAELDGAEGSRHARRGYSRFARESTLQLMAVTGNPNLEIILFAWRPKDAKFWWAEWYQLRASSDPDIPRNFFPVLAPASLSWQPGQRESVAVIPSAAEAGRKMELAVIDDIRRKLVARIPFEYTLPVTHVPVPVGDWRTGLYRILLAPAGAPVDPGSNNLNQKLANVIVRPKRPSGGVLFVAPTDMWLAYSTNGGHDYHGWRTGYDGSVGYSPTVMSSRQRRLNNFYYSLYERYSDIHHFRYIDTLADREGFAIDYATQHDVALGRVRLDDYRLVLIGNHSEFTTRESYQRFDEYLGRGGGVMIHGGDSFAVLVEYLPDLAEPRYLWQRGHIRTHLGDASGSFRTPVFLPADAPPSAPILGASAGDAVDYLNVFHTTVGYWIPGSRAVIANPAHPVLQGLNLRPGDEVPGPWGGEVDIPYEPQGWDILIRSDRAAPESREFGVDANDPTAFHRVGLALHRNERLAMVCGENFPNILASPEASLYREIYRRTLLHLLQAAPAGEPRRVSITRPNLVDMGGPERVTGVRYTLPTAIGFANPEWHRAPAPYSHYLVEGSLDGVTWLVLADRRHGPWRSERTDRFPPAEVRYLRWTGEVSNGERLRIRGAEVWIAHPTR